MAALKTRLNLWIALGLIFANLFVWARLLLAVTNPHVVDPIMDPEVRALLDYIRSGDHSGETWEVTLYPEVDITPDSVSGEGDVIITGLHIHVSGETRVTLKDGLPVVEILDLSLPVPASMKEAIEQEIQVVLDQ